MAVKIPDRLTAAELAQLTPDQKRRRIVQSFEARNEKNSYTQGAKRDQFFGSPEGSAGNSDCSSSAYHAVKRAAGIEIGGNTAAQINNRKKYTVVLDNQDGKTRYPDESKMLPGDMLYFKGNASHPLGVGHVECYCGNGLLRGHGSGKGPKKHDLKSYCDSRGKNAKWLMVIRHVAGDSDTEGQMGDASRNPYPKPTKTLKKGSKGSGVKWVQRQLTFNGYATVLVDGRPKDVYVDGEYGPITVAAVKAFQRAHKDAKSKPLKADGIVGKLTRNALDGPSEPVTQPETPRPETPQREALIVDISQHNAMKHSKNDWAKIAASVDMLIVRCGVTRTATKPIGIGIDAEFTYIAKKCAEYGIPMGVYYYGKVKSIEDARREADKCWETASPYNPCVYAYDVEETRLSNAMVEAWMDQMAVRGADPERVGLYLAHHLYDQFKAAAKKAAFLWIPRYGKNKGKLDKLPNYACDIHQYTSVGDGHKLGFYDDTVDLNRLCGSKSLAWFTGENERAVETPPSI